MIEVGWPNTERVKWEAHIKVLPKKDRDPLELLSKIIAERLAVIMPHLINKTQIRKG